MTSHNIKGTGLIELYLWNFRLKDKTELVKSSPILIFEGILSLYDIRLRNLMDIKIFVLTDDDVRLARRCNYSKPQLILIISVKRLFRKR